jgi:hypothetical protein
VKTGLLSCNVPRSNDETRKGLKIVGVQGQIRTGNLPNTAVADLCGKTVGLLYH